MPAPLRFVGRRLPQYFAFLAVAVLYLAGLFNPPASPVFTVDIWSRGPTYAQLLADTGGGLRGLATRPVAVPASSCLDDVAAGAEPPCPPFAVSFALAPGRYRGFRLDTVTPGAAADGLVYLHGPRVDPDKPGAVRDFAWSTFTHPEATIVADRFAGGVKAETNPPATGVQFFLDLSADPVRLAGWPEAAKGAVVLVCLLLAMVVVAVLDRRADRAGGAVAAAVTPRRQPPADGSPSSG